MSKKIKLVDKKSAVGKTISAFGMDEERALIAFTDGTALALIAESDCYEGTSIDLAGWLNDELDLMTATWADAADDAGLITREEWRQVHQESKAAKVQRLKNELAELER